MSRNTVNDRQSMRQVQMSEVMKHSKVSCRLRIGEGIILKQCWIDKVAREKMTKEKLAESLRQLGMEKRDEF